MTSRERVDRAWPLVQAWVAVLVAKVHGRVEGYALAKRHEREAV